VKTFDESYFVIALTERDNDARTFSQVFSPHWLRDKALTPVLEALYDFRKEFRVNPSLSALHEYMESQDADMYNNRHKATLAGLELYKVDNAKLVLATTKAKEVGSSLALEALIHSQSFQKALADGEGDSLLKMTRQFISQWDAAAEGEGVFSIREAFDKLIDDNAWSGRPDRIASGIAPLDLWTNGGLRPRQLGIMLAPTGGGKSAFLANVAHNVASVDQLPVLFLTNELSVNEQSERFLVRMQKPVDRPDGSLHYRTLQEVQDDPSVAYRGLNRRWAVGLEKRLYLASVDIGQTADDIEEMLKQLRIEEGFNPAVIVIDYMERMAPTNKVNREKEWIWMGEIAKELVRLAKRTETLVWTASQTNRSGLAKGAVLDLTMGQGSIRHFQEAAFVGAMRKRVIPLTTEGEQDVNTLEFSEQKQRHNAMEDRVALLKHDLARMYISKEEVFEPADADPEDDGDDSSTKPSSGVIMSPWAAKGGGS
jgi:KaiC/GvpD/RAD55 family RecA-like ATPase